MGSTIRRNFYPHPTSERVPHGKHSDKAQIFPIDSFDPNAKGTQVGNQTTRFARDGVQTTDKSGRPAGATFPLRSVNVTSLDQIDESWSWLPSLWKRRERAVNGRGS